MNETEDAARADAALARRIAVLRAAAGLSQEEVARGLTERGVQAYGSTVARLERGERHLKFEEAFHLAAVLGVSVLDLAPPNPQIEASCPFCDIVTGQSETEVLSFDQAADTLMFRPLNPVVPGHLLVIPRTHVTDFADDPRVTEKVMGSAARYAREIGGDFNLITSKGEAATQSVFHLHVHLVPRHERDGLPLPWTGQEKRERLRAMVDNPPFPSGLVRLPPMTQEEIEAIPFFEAVEVTEEQRALFEVVEQHLRTTALRYVNPDGSPWRRPANSLNMTTLGRTLRPVSLDASAFTIDRKDIEGWQPSTLDRVRHILREQENTALLEEWYGVKRCTARTETEDGLLHWCVRADHPSKHHLSTSGYEWEAEA